MANDIKIFNNPEFGDIRTIKMNGDPFFVAKDVFGYSIQLIKND